MRTGPFFSRFQLVFAAAATSNLGQPLSYHRRRTYAAMGRLSKRQGANRAIPAAREAKQSHQEFEYNSVPVKEVEAKYSSASDSEEDEDEELE